MYLNLKRFILLTTFVSHNIFTVVPQKYAAKRFFIVVSKFIILCYTLEITIKGYTY